MAKRKGQEELFEIFQRREAVRRGISKEEIPEEAKERAEGEEKLAPAAKPAVSPIMQEAGYRFSIGSRPQVVFSLSFNACIILVVGFVVFCALIYGIGFWIGKRARPRTLQEIRSSVEKEPGPLDLEAEGRRVEAVTPAVGDYALRIISYGAGQKEMVKKVVEFLDKVGVPKLFCVQSPEGRLIVVYSGPYPKGDDPSLKELQEKVHGLAFEGREDFKDAKIVKFVRKR